MVSYQYTYIIGDIIILAFWLLLFLKRKDTRKEMLIISLIFGIIGPFAEYVYIKDWWKPLTITGTAIGIEDFLFSFGIGGVASVIYCYLFNKRIKTRKFKKIKEEKKNLNFIILSFLGMFTFLFCFSILKINSFFSTVLTFLSLTLIIWFKRKDLIKNSILSGISILILTILGYQLLNLISPGFFDEFWLFENIGKIMILGIPLEELIWFFLAGMLIGPLYEYWKEAKLINIKN